MPKWIEGTVVNQKRWTQNLFTLQVEADVAQLLVTTTEVYGATTAVGAAVDVFGRDAILMASRRLTKSAMPSRIRKSVADSGAVMSAARDEVKRQTGADQIKPETITRVEAKALPDT